MDLPKVIGHRGAAGVAPENTLGGFRVAASLGVEWVEFDVRLTRDETCVVVHDETLKRIAGIDVAIDQTDFSEIRQWTQPDPIPTLAETMELLDGLGLGANIEIKPDRRRRVVARHVARAARRARRRGRSPVLVSSRDGEALVAVASEDAGIALGLVVFHPRLNVAKAAKRFGCRSIHCRDVWLTASRTAAWRRSGFQTVGFTINEPARAEKLFSWGVEAVISDTPGTLLGALAAVGKAGLAVGE